MASKTFKKLGKSKLARGLLAAAAIYFLGSYLSDSTSAAASPNMFPEGGLDPETLANATGGGSELITEPPGTPLEPLAPPPPPAVAAPPPTPAAQAAARQPTSQQGANAFAGGRAEGELGDGKGIFSSAARWFSNLTPDGQAVLAGGTMGGTAAVMRALAQKNDQEWLDEREQRARDDRTRRTAVAAMAPGAIRSRGIIGSRRG